MPERARSSTRGRLYTACSERPRSPRRLHRRSSLPFENYTRRHIIGLAREKPTRRRGKDEPGADRARLLRRRPDLPLLSPRLQARSTELSARVPLPRAVAGGLAPLPPRSGTGHAKRAAADAARAVGPTVRSASRAVAAATPGACRGPVSDTVMGPDARFGSGALPDAAIRPSPASASPADAASVVLNPAPATCPATCGNRRRAYPLRGKTAESIPTGD